MHWVWWLGVQSSDPELPQPAASRALEGRKMKKIKALTTAPPENRR
jgi:hypothetical protein